MAIRLTLFSLSSLFWASVALADNSIAINQTGNNVVINIEQTGNGNTIAGHGASAMAQLHGDNNTTILKQGVGSNQLPGSMLLIDVIGIGNYVNTQQGDSHWMDILVLGNSNSITASQWDDPTKSTMIGADGDYNTVLINQKGSGSMSANIILDGNGHTIDVIQDGTGNHSANISAHNSGGPSNILLDQNGSTNKNYSIDQYCAAPSGCGVAITQY